MPSGKVGTLTLVTSTPASPAAGMTRNNSLSHAKRLTGQNSKTVESDDE